MTLWLLLGFLLGVLVAGLLSVAWIGWLAGCALLAALALALPSCWRPLALIPLAVGLGGLRLAWHERPPDGPHLAALPDESALLVEGVVVSDPERVGSHWRYRLAVERRQQDGHRVPLAGGLLIQDSEPARYGDRLELSGRLRVPPRFEQFDYAAYLARQGVSRVVYYPRQRLLARDQGWRPLGLLYDLRHTLGAALDRHLGEPQASLARGILLGQRSDIPSDLERAFARTSTSHIVAISGYNIEILVVAMAALAVRWTGRRHLLWWLLPTVLVYACLTGLSSSVLRAAWMTALVAVAATLGRPTQLTLVLLQAASLMALVDPLVLRDLSFQLSYLATLGLVWLVPPLAELWNRWGCLRGRLRPVGVWLGTGLSVTLAAHLATLPVLALNFGTVAILGPLINLVAVPLLPPIMATTGLLAVGASLWAPLGDLLTGPAWLCLSTLIRVVETGAALPGVAVELERLPSWLGGLYYALLGTVTMVYWLRQRGMAGTVPWQPRAFAPLNGPRRQRPAWQIALWAGACLAGLGAPLALQAAAQASDSLRVVALDVPGGATLVQAPQGHTLLLNCQAEGGALVRELSRWLPPGAARLDQVYLLNPSRRAIQAAEQLQERYQLGQIWGAPGASNRRGAATAVSSLAPGAKFHWGDVSLQIVSAEPPAVWLGLDGEGVLILASGADAQAQRRLAESGQIPRAALLFACEPEGPVDPELAHRADAHLVVSEPMADAPPGDDLPRLRRGPGEAVVYQIGTGVGPRLITRR